MKFTLRQAHKLVEKINAKIGSLDLNPLRHVNIWQVDDTTFATLQAEFKAQIGRQQALIDARRQIREQIGIANSDMVDGLVAQRKFLLDQIGTLRTIISEMRPNEITTPEALLEKAYAAVAASKAGTSRGFGDDTVTICLIDDAEHLSYTKEIDNLQLKIEDVENALTIANGRATVDLNDHVVSTLRTERLIV